MRRTLDAGDLLHGDDHEFVVNLYLAVLRRWPDEAGYRHFMEQVFNRPERRVEAIREIAGSEEAHRQGSLVTLAPRPIPSDPHRARDLILSLRTEVLHEEMGRLQQALELLSGSGVAEVAALQGELAEARDAELRSELNSLRRGMALLTAPPPPAASARMDLAQGLAQLLDAYLAERLGGFESRLAALEARLPPPP